MAAKDPQSQSVSAGHGSVTGSSAGLGDDKRTIGDADNYAMGMCRDVSDMLRIVISNDLVQIGMHTGISAQYVKEVKNRDYDINKAEGSEKTKDDLNDMERQFINCIECLRQIFSSDKKKSVKPESNEWKKVKQHFRRVTALLNSIGIEGKSLLIDPAIDRVRSSDGLIQDIAQQLSHALMDQLLMNQGILELIGLAGNLGVFKDKSQPISGTADFLGIFKEMWRRISEHKTHVKYSAEDATAYRKFTYFLATYYSKVFDEKMMEQFPDYEMEMEEDKALEEESDGVKKYQAVMGRTGALPDDVTLQEIKKSVIERGEAITPQILAEMYPRVALCMRINDAYTIDSNTIRYSVLCSRWVGRRKDRNNSQEDDSQEDDSQKAKMFQENLNARKSGPNKIRDSLKPALQQAIWDSTHWVNQSVDKRELTDYQCHALEQVYKELVNIYQLLQQHSSEQYRARALETVDKLLQGLCKFKKESVDTALKRDPCVNIRQSPFYDKTLEEFSACFKTYEQNKRDVPTVSDLSALLTRLQVAVLDEVLVEVSDGLGYILKNLWFPANQMHFREDMKKLLVVVNERKHGLSFFYPDKATSEYLDNFSSLFDNFFTPELAGLCSTNQMIGERTKSGVYWWD